MYRRALEAREKVLGSEHPDTLDSVNNLGSVLDNRGKYRGRCIDGHKMDSGTLMQQQILPSKMLSTFHRLLQLSHRHDRSLGEQHDRDVD